MAFTCKNFPMHAAQYLRQKLLTTNKLLASVKCEKLNHLFEVEQW